MTTEAIFCPACERPVVSFHESVYRAPWVEPCGHTLGIGEAAEIHAEIERRWISRETVARP